MERRLNEIGTINLCSTSDRSQSNIYIYVISEVRPPRIARTPRFAETRTFREYRSIVDTFSSCHHFDRHVFHSRDFSWKIKRNVETMLSRSNSNFSGNKYAILNRNGTVGTRHFSKLFENIYLHFSRRTLNYIFFHIQHRIGTKTLNINDTNYRIWKISTTGRQERGWPWALKIKRSQMFFCRKFNTCLFRVTNAVLRLQTYETWQNVV